MDGRLQMVAISNFFIKIKQKQNRSSQNTTIYQPIHQKSQMSWHYMCNYDAHYCGSGCCDFWGDCATIPANCYYAYSNYPNASRYSYPGLYNSQCNSYSRYCSSGCCTYSGNCATSLSDCTYRYPDYYTNGTKYSYGMNVVNVTNVGGIVGGVVGGVFGLVIIIALIIWWKRRQASMLINETSYNNNDNNGGTTIIMTNPVQPAYGMTPQPTYNMNQPVMMNQYQPGYQQPVYQPGYQQQQGYPMNPPQQGPIIITT